jgi:hypothetical protein
MAVVGPLNSATPTTAQVVGGVYNATAPAPVTAQALALQQDPAGNLLVNVAVGGGVVGQYTILSAKPTTAQTTLAPISFSGSGANTVVAGVAGQTVRVWRLLIVMGGTTNITFADTTPTSFTGAMPMLANGSITLDFDSEPYFVTATGKGFVINSSNGVQVSGGVWYTQS